MKLAGGLNWVDLAVLTFLVASVLFGYVRGLLRTIVGVFSYLIALVLAGRYAAPVLEWVDGKLGLTVQLSRVLVQYIQIPDSIAHTPISSLSLAAARTQLDNLPVPSAYRAALVQQLIGTATADPSRSFADWLASAMVGGILKAVAFLLFVVITIWVLRMLSQTVSGILDAIPLIGTANRLLGAAAGGLMSAISVALALGLLAPALSLPFAAGLAGDLGAASTVPYFSRLYEWLGGWFFGYAGQFFLGNT